MDNESHVAENKPTRRIDILYEDAMRELALIAENYKKQIEFYVAQFPESEASMRRREAEADVVRTLTDLFAPILSPGAFQ